MVPVAEELVSYPNPTGQTRVFLGNPLLDGTAEVLECKGVDKIIVTLRGGGWFLAKLEDRTWS